MKDDELSYEELPRLLDLELVTEDIEKRIDYLEDYLNARLSSFDAGITEPNSTPSLSMQQRARRFGELLVSDSRGLLAFDRGYSITTNWNTPEEEEEMCRLTAELGEAYYRARSKAGRRAAIAHAVAFFTYLPMVLEEIAEEERSVRSPGWNDTPIEKRRMWGKAMKNLRQLPSKVDPRFLRRPFGNLAINHSGEESKTNAQGMSAPPQNVSTTPARKRFAEIRRSKSRH